MGENPPELVNPESPYHARPGEVIDPTRVKVFRGGDDLEVKPGEIRVIDRQVQPTHGPSLETDPSRLGRFGGARRVISIADDLQVIQRGKRDTHCELVPKEPMPPDRYQELVKET